MSSRQIPLTQGKFAVVDASDYEWLSQWKWLLKDKRYAARGRRNSDPPGGQFVYMRREVLGLGCGGDLRPDHINGDALDNRRCNLRACTQAENVRNRRPHRSGSLGFKGIRRQRSGFCAQIMVDGRRHYSGQFKTAEAAARAYDGMARKFHGEFACLNFPDRHDVGHESAASSRARAGQPRSGGDHERRQDEAA